MKLMSVLLMALFVSACANTNCRTLKEQRGETAAPIQKGTDPMEKTSLADRVRVFKPDGSLQCDRAKPVPVATMQTELKGILVHASFNQNDGLLRVQMCGAPTGNSNVYEINRSDLEAALKLGFKEWTQI